MLIKCYVSQCVNDEECEMWDDGSAISEEMAPSVGDNLPSHISAAPGEFPSPRKKSEFLRCLMCRMLSDHYIIDADTSRLL